jgi:hypothetical protein
MDPLWYVSLFGICGTQRYVYHRISGLPNSLFQTDCRKLSEFFYVDCLTTLVSVEYLVVRNSEQRERQAS